MPTPKNLQGTMPKTGPKTDNKPAPNKPAPKPAPVAPVPVTPVPAQPVKTLIPSNQPKALAVPIPGFLQQTDMPETSSRTSSGYVGFASSASERWGDMQAAGLNEGQAFLYHQQSYIPLEQLEFFLCAGTSFKTMMAGKKGEFIYVTRDMNEKRDPVIYKGNQVKLEPHYVVLMLVKIGDTLLPIKGDFRGTKSGGMENAIRAVASAADPNWLKLSETHKATAAFPQPWGRVYNVIRPGNRQISKSNGNPYYTAECSPSPANVSQMQLLVGCLNSDDFNNQLNQAYDNYNKRIEFLDNVNENRAREEEGQKDKRPFA